MKPHHKENPRNIVQSVRHADAILSKVKPCESHRFEVVNHRIIIVTVTVAKVTYVVQCCSDISSVCP